MKEPLCKKGIATIRINSEPPKPTTFEDLGYVQVVRCKDCRYCNKRNCADGYGWCNRNGEGHGTTDDWFCADWEKRE